MEVSLQRKTIVFLKNRRAKNAKLLNGGKCAIYRALKFEIECF